MIVRRFLAWAQTAPSAGRADGASALARALLYSDLPREDRREAEIALTALLDDPSPLVRRALAEAIGGAGGAPHHLVVGLAHDQSDISAIVLARSPLLTEADLVDCVALGDVFAQTAIALRPRVGAGVGAALAEVGGREALIALAVNPGAEIPDFAIRRIIARFGRDGEMREALLSRGRLSASLRHDLVVATAAALAEFVAGAGFLSRERAERATREARERADVIIAMEAGAAGATVAELVAHLREAGQLTPNLLLRALLCADGSLFAATLADLSGLPPARVAGILRSPRGSAFDALYARARLPAPLLPAFRAGLAALPRAERPSRAGELSLDMIAAMLEACAASSTPELARVGAMLRRLEAEASREAARALAAELAANETAVAPALTLAAVEEFAPVEDVAPLGEPPIVDAAPIEWPEAAPPVAIAPASGSGWTPEITPPEAPARAA